MNKRVEIVFGIIFLLFVTFVMTIFYIDKIITDNATGQIFTDINKVPKNEVALVLGTSKQAKSGRPNLFFETRLDAVEKLYKSGKVKAILISGDNSTRYYSEPQDMKEGLIERGIDEDKIFLDYAGFRTLDSIVRADKIFDLKKYTIVSQKFHCERAIYIAHKKGYSPICFAAKDVDTISTLRILIREKLARVKAWLDVNVLFKQPKFFGEKVEITI